MKWTKLFCLAALATLSTLTASPVYQWDFEQWKDNKTPARPGNVNMDGAPAEHQGVQNSTGLLCADKVRNQLAYFNLDWSAFTIDFQFKLERPLDGKCNRTLLCYAPNSWNRQRLLISILRNKRIEVDFKSEDEKTKKDRRYVVTSNPLKINTGKFYRIRIASISGGDLKVWLDNKPIAAKSDAWSLKDLKMSHKVEWHPILAFGFDLHDPRVIGDPLFGVIDNVRMWDSFEEPNLMAEPSMQDNVSAHIVLNGETTAPFTVLDHEQGPAGNFVTAEDKFVRNAATASGKIIGKSLVVHYHCPIPAGMTAKGGTEGWSGDAVEFFIKPKAKSNVYFQYAANADGGTYIAKFKAPGAADKSFRTAATIKVDKQTTHFDIDMTIPLIELGIDKTFDGQCFTGNFTRSGKTAGGLSTWAPVGQSFHNPDAFAPIFIGSRKAYFNKQLEQVTPEAEKLNVDLSDLTKLIETNSNNPLWFDRINQAFEALRMTFVQKALAGVRQLIFQPDCWGNRLEVNAYTEPLKKISVDMPRNSLHYVGFAIANLTDKPYLGQIKCFPKTPYQWSSTKFCSEPFNQLCTQIAFNEGIESWNVSGMPLYDAIAPLHMNTIVRIPPHKIVPIWMEISTKDIPAGMHHSVITLKDGSGHPGMTFVELELNVRDVDLATAPINTFQYTYLQQSNAFQSEQIYKFFGKHEVNFLYCTPGQLDVYPLQRKDGSLEAMDYTELDAMIDSGLAGGIPRERAILHFFLALNGGYGMRKPQSDKFPKGVQPRFAILSPQWKRGIAESLRNIGEHVQQKYGITQDRIILYPFDEPNGDIDNPKSKMYEALQYCKFLKTELPGMKIMVNPHPANLSSERENAFRKLAPYVDIFELYRPNANDNKSLVKLVKELKKEVWTYSICSNATHPAGYRQDYWNNMRDGFSSIATYWHLESMAGGDGFDQTDTSYGGNNRTDYGTIYADFNYGTVIPGRRFIAGRLGQEERKIFQFCLNHIEKAGDKAPAIKKQLDGIIAKGSDGSMEQMDAARLELLKFAEALNARHAKH